MPKSISVEVNPEVFKWLRESSGWTIEEVAKRLNTTAKIIRDIEAGNRKPTLRQLRELSSAFKVPLAAFLLPKPRIEKWPKDYRMIPGKEGVFDKKTIVVLRRAINLQEIAKNLLKNLEYDIAPKIDRVKQSDNPEEIAKKYREMFGLSETKQREFSSAYAMFNYLKEKLENLNIFVFQFSMPVEDARGFTLVDECPVVIVVNSKDVIEARIFTLMHEFAHVLLGESAIDSPDILTPAPISIEKWCNEFAASILLPREVATRIFVSYRPLLTDPKTLSRLSNKLKVSKQMLLYNMAKLNFITKKEYAQIVNSYRPQKVIESEEKESEQKEGRPPPDKKAISEIGEKFISVLLYNLNREYITYADALSYLSVKSKTFEKVLAEVGR
ncbi:hypothetical protein DRP07_10390 [Archaeoglobales archaeon]|nr:MAG: hypothetical protein DRP07_10390 [Archaeoglobales archaeon]